MYQNNKLNNNLNLQKNQIKQMKYQNDFNNFNKIDNMKILFQ